MVVNKLQTYIQTEIPESLHTANLRELIREELSRGVLEPTLVLDASSLFWLFHSDESSIFEMQPGSVKKKIQDFLDKIISCKARLIVILRGGKSKLESWYHKYKSVKIDFEKCRRGVVDDFLKAQLNLPCVICTNITLSSISNEKCSVISAKENTHILVAQIAAKQNCFAVIGEDSDYLIHEGIQHYILTSSINVETLDCTCYDRNKLIEHLQLKSYHLPLLATLCGNNFISFHWLKNFHRRISELNSNKFLDVAKIIRQTTSNPYSHLKDIVALINHPMVSDKLLEESLDSYLNYKETVLMNKWESFADEKRRNNEWSKVTHRIFTSKMYITSTMTGLDPNIHRILRSLRKNIYGVLFYEFDLVVIEEYCLEELKISRKKTLAPVCVLPKKPQCEHPGLVRLWDKTFPAVNSQKWTLFCSSVSQSLRSSILRKVPSKLLIPVLALHYLKVNSPSIFAEEFELETFLIVAVLIHENLLIKNAQSGELDFRIAQLIFIFTETCCMLQILNEACGLVILRQDSCFCNFYDGVLVFYVYKKMKKGTRWNKFLCGNKDLEDEFCALMDIILIGESG